MNWIKENKFVTGLLIVVLLGAGLLTYLLFTAMGQADEAKAAYEQQISERNRLRNLKIFPSKGNLDLLIQQKTEAGKAISALQADLAKNELPVNPITPEAFQDKLRAAVTDIRNAAANRTKLLGENEKFYLGFQEYETTPPDKAAAPALARELDAMKWLMLRFIEGGVSQIKSLKRDQLPEELGKKAKDEKPAASAPGKGRAAAATDKPAQPLVMKHGIDIVALADQASLREVLNKIVASKEQFFIPRVIEIKNEKGDKGPSRLEGNAQPGEASPLPSPDAAAPAADGAAPAAQPAPTGPAQKFIVGEEKVEMTLRLELVDFAEPSPK